MIKVLIVDDEASNRSFLRKVIEKSRCGLHVAGEASAISEALHLIKLHSPELVFLDIIMRNETGFQLLAQADEINFEIIFTTAHENYAIKAFRCNAVDYLLKPLQPDELFAAIEKAKKRIASRHFVQPEQLKNLFASLQTQQKNIHKITIPTIDGFILVPADEIIYCVSESNYTHFCLSDNRRITSAYTLKEYAAMLEGSNFFRLHKSYLVNVGHITKYIKGDGGSVVMSNGAELEVSRKQKDLLIQLLKN